MSQSKPQSGAFDTARDFAAHGYPVFPTHYAIDGRCSCGRRDCSSPGKHPRTSDGFKSATTDERTLLQWDDRFTGANWAVACGDRLSVIDIDSKSGANPRKIIDELGLTGPTVWTGEAPDGELAGVRGAHVYCQNGVATGASAVLGVEIRAAGAYVLLPGSRHVSGRVYEWHDVARPWTVDLKAVPGALAPKPTTTVTAPPVGDIIPAGQRDQTLASLAGTMRRKGMSEAAILAALTITNRESCRPPLDDEQVRKIAHSIARYAPKEGAAAVDRYEGRHVDLVPLLAAPAKPIPWRVRDLVADGTVTILAGESGSGKSWFAQALCIGVARGLPVAGLPCSPGNALYVDAEMGPQMFVDQRLRPAGVNTPEFDYIDAMGLDVSKDADLAWVRSKIEQVEANLVVVDSLRRLTPSKSENDSDDMAPVIALLAKLARDTSTAVVLIHHKGDGEKFYRGSTAIRDQTDALFALLRDGQPDEGEGEDDGVRRLRCRGGKGKMRYAPEPPDVYLAISPEDGGVVACDAPSPRPRAATTRETVKQAILAALPVKTKGELTESIGRSVDDPTFRAAWRELKESCEIAHTAGVWKRVVVSTPSPPPPPPFSKGAGSLRLVAPSDGLDDLSPERPVDDLFIEAKPAPLCQCDRPLPGPDEHGEVRCGKCGHPTP